METSATTQTRETLVNDVEQLKRDVTQVAQDVRSHANAHVDETKQRVNETISNVRETLLANPLYVLGAGFFIGFLLGVRFRR